MPAPSAIAVMGSLLLVTNTFDPALTAYQSTFEYIKTPQSLRATIIQVTNEAYWAMSSAHTNMDRIRLNTMRVPGYFKSVIHVLTKGSLAEQSRTLPRLFNRIRGIADSCAGLANETVSSFDKVTKLVEEVIIVCTVQEKHDEDAARSVKIELDIANKKSLSLKKVMDEMKERAAREEAKMDEAFKRVQETIDEMPSNFKLFLARVGDTLTNMLTLFTPSGNGVLGMLGLGLDNSGGRRQDVQIIEMDIKKVVDYNNLQHCLAEIIQFAGKPNEAIEQIKDGTNGQARDTARDLKARLKVQKGGLNVLKYAVIGKYEALKLIDRGVELCNQIELASSIALSRGAARGNSTRQQTRGHRRNRRAIHSTGNELKNLERKAAGWFLDLKALEVRVSKLTGNAPGANNLAQVQDVSYVNLGGGGGSTAVAMLASAQIKIKERQKMMNQAREQYAYQQARYDASFREQMELLDQLGRLKPTMNHFQETIKVLKIAIKKLGELRDHWINMTIFFQRVANLLQHQWGPKINDFIDQVIDDNVLQNVEMSVDNSVTRNFVYKETFEALTHNYQVYRIAQTYIAVSKEYFLEPLSKVHHLLSIEPFTVDYNQTQIDLKQKVFEALESINQTLVTDRELFYNGVQKMRDSLNVQFGSLCKNERLVEAWQEITDEANRRADQKDEQEGGLDDIDYYSDLSAPYFNETENTVSSAINATISPVNSSDEGSNSSDESSSSSDESSQLSH
uniref:Uncharacterized protein n=1 Tax=Plectus sambesii TaxID=2011161 RepID=A0A914X436_9BILA